MVKRLQTPKRAPSLLGKYSSPNPIQWKRLFRRPPILSSKTSSINRLSSSNSKNSNMKAMELVMLEHMRIMKKDQVEAFEASKIFQTNLEDHAVKNNFLFLIADQEKKKKNEPLNRSFSDEKRTYFRQPKLKTQCHLPKKVAPVRSPPHVFVVENMVIGLMVVWSPYSKEAPSKEPPNTAKLDGGHGCATNGHGDGQNSQANLPKSQGDLIIIKSRGIWAVDDGEMIQQKKLKIMSRKEKVIIITMNP
ncbi:hypothetical protein PIB30_061743 [Stylosanthes scabra]|uniref:Uncharacterized protein n=1 Tax=Stylosanthes scabra TaxID=79078 RepID=A0ABU6RKV5_9FABA|nr:hypothetical protein [Stylosanthes scabra]